MTTNRVQYGFNLNFPKQFTLQDLIRVQAYNAKRAGRVAPRYITCYMRVKKALKNGVITVVGKRTPAAKRRGAHEKLYARVNAKTVEVTTSAVTPVVSVVR